LADKVTQSDFSKPFNTIRGIDLSARLQSNDFKTVITGDSISYNRQDYMGTEPLDAYKAQAGMLSWSFVLRDTIHRNDPYFVSAEEIVPVAKTGFTETFTGSTLYSVPFNGIYNYLSTASSANVYQFKFQTNKASSKIVFYFTENQYATTCTFDIYVNDVFKATVNNDNLSGNYQGFAPIIVDVTGDFTPGDLVDIKFKNFTNASGNKELIFQGVGTIKRNVYLTGHGGWKASDFLADINNRVLQYVPDLVILSLGANDIYGNVPVATYKSNMEQIINQIRTTNSLAEIVLLTSPQTLAYTESQQTPYNDALKALAIQYNCFYVDLIKLFKNVPISSWRFDNVHLSKLGNEILGRFMINLLMPVSTKKDIFISSYRYFTSRFYTPPATTPTPTSYNLTLLNSWVNYGAGYEPLTVTKIGNEVIISGTLKSGTITNGTAIFNLPVELRPANTCNFNINSFDGTTSVSSMVQITGGNLVCASNVKNSMLPLNGIRYFVS
jgi:hypothetical protein